MRFYKKRLFWCFMIFLVLIIIVVLFITIRNNIENNKNSIRYGYLQVNVEDFEFDRHEGCSNEYDICFKNKEVNSYLYIQENDSGVLEEEEIYPKDDLKDAKSVKKVKFNKLHGYEYILKGKDSNLLYLLYDKKGNIYEISFFNYKLLKKGTIKKVMNSLRIRNDYVNNNFPSTTTEIKALGNRKYRTDNVVFSVPQNIEFNECIGNHKKSIRDGVLKVHSYLHILDPIKKVEEIAITNDSYQTKKIKIKGYDGLKTIDEEEDNYTYYFDLLVNEYSYSFVLETSKNEDQSYYDAIFDSIIDSITIEE